MTPLSIDVTRKVPIMCVHFTIEVFPEQTSCTREVEREKEGDAIFTAVN